MSMLMYCPIACEIFIISVNKKTGLEEEKAWFDYLPEEIQRENLCLKIVFLLELKKMYEFKELTNGTYFVKVLSLHSTTLTSFIDCQFSSTLIPSMENRWQMILSSNGAILEKEIIKGTPGNLYDDYMDFNDYMD